MVRQLSIGGGRARKRDNLPRYSMAEPCTCFLQMPIRLSRIVRSVPLPSIPSWSMGETSNRRLRLYITFLGVTPNRESWDHIIVDIGCMSFICGANCNDQGIVCRCSVEWVCTTPILVTSCSSDYNTVQPQDLSSGTKRTLMIRLFDCGLDREVDNPDVVLLFIVEDPLHGFHGI